MALLSAAALLDARRLVRAADAGAVSDWVAAGQSKVRLIDAGAMAAGDQHLAGLEIALEPDVLTYWRTPGEAGVPPTLDFAASANLARAEVLFPAPTRYDEGGAEAFGYKNGVVFPIVATPTAAAAPIDLAVSLSFALCAKLCLPAQAAVALRLSSQGIDPEAGLVREALSRVPVVHALGAGGPLAIESVVASPDGAQLTVLAHTKSVTAAALFPEAPDPWFLQADAGTPEGADRTRFSLRILARPEGASARLKLRLTLVGEDKATQTTTDLDVAFHKP